MTFQLPEPVIKKSTLLSHPDSPLFGALYTEAQLKQALRDALEQAAQVAVDAVAFDGGTVQMEAHVREAIRKMIGEIK